MCCMVVLNTVSSFPLLDSILFDFLPVFFICRLVVSYTTAFLKIIRFSFVLISVIPPFGIVIKGSECPKSTL